MGNEKMGLVASVDAKLDAIGDKLKKKEWKLLLFLGIEILFNLQAKI